MIEKLFENETQEKKVDETERERRRRINLQTAENYKNKLETVNLPNDNILSHKWPGLKIKIDKHAMFISFQTPSGFHQMSTYCNPISTTIPENEFKKEVDETISKFKEMANQLKPYIQNSSEWHLNGSGCTKTQEVI